MDRVTKDERSRTKDAKQVGAPAKAPLAMDPEAFRAAGHRLVDQVAEFLATLPQRPVTRDQTPSSVRDAFGLEGPLPEHGTEAGPLLERTAELLFEHSLFNGHPRFYGFITAPPAPVGILGDLLASTINPNVGAWILSPAATEIEAQTVRWIAELIGYPTDTGGLLVSGGNLANLVCFFAARAAKADWEVREKGHAGGEGRRMIVYGSTETHTWIEKGADLAGLGTESMRWIATDDQQRMDLDALRRQIDADRKAGHLPFMVVGAGGTVSTGAVDPLREIATLCREQDLWFHVDGAYGGFAACVPEAPEDLHAIADADSVAVDPHKWLYAPLEAGCALVRDTRALRGAFSYDPPYYNFEEWAVNYVELGPQNSRGFRALKVWLALQQAGASGYRQMISHDIAMSKAMAEAVRAYPEIEFGTQALSITTFRFVPAALAGRVGDEVVDTYLDALNRELLDQLQRGGEVFVSNAVVGSRFLLRACIVNFHTQVSDVQAVPEIVARAGRAIDATMRPAELDGEGQDGADG